MKVLFSCALLILASGCETLKPWERDLLAKPEMQLNDDVNQGALNDQVFASKEAASGSATASGAGCGCN